MDSSGLFSLKGIKDRSVLKLAPDAIAIMNNAFGEKAISPMDPETNNSFSVSGNKESMKYLQGGITSINVSASISPSGSGRANIEVVAPQYKGLHNDYYVDMPNGIRVPYFLPMTEVKIFMKSRFIEKAPANKYRPQYYPVFWGFITNVTESYSGGVSTFSLNCVDLLNWWAFQKLTVAPSLANTILGSNQKDQISTIFEFMNPWEIIYSLFLDTFFNRKGSDSTDNFVYPNFSSLYNNPQIGNVSGDDVGKVLGGLARSATEYWSRRFDFQSFAGPDGIIGDKSASEEDLAKKGKAALEMYGLVGPIELKSIAQSVKEYMSTSDKSKNRTTRAELDLDFSILERVLPYGAFSLYGDGSQSLQNTKLEIANKICEDTHMEFFVDLNGSFVFKPPMYNLDVVFGGDETYVMKSEDIINFSFSQNTDAIVNYLEVTGPFNYHFPELAYLGVHIDYESVKRYGLRHQTLSMNYGNTPATLRAIAVAEMARINAKTKTGALSIPLRSEMRLGYPVYISHADCFYYVSGISHSFSFGSSATTQLNLEARRDRVFDSGEVTSVPGKILKGYVVKLRNEISEILAEGKAVDDEKLEPIAQGARTQGDLGKDNKANELNKLQKQYLESTSGLYAGNNSEGFTEIRPASKEITRDKVVDQGKPEDGNTDAETSLKILSNEMIHITKETVPYTDKNGYEHIGAFPYGANLLLDREDNYKFVDLADRINSEEYKNIRLLKLKPKDRG